MLDISLNQNSAELLASLGAVEAIPEVFGVTYMSVPCGGGKTYALTRHIKEAFDRAPFDEPQQFMYVALTVELLRQFSGDLAALGIEDQTLIASTDDKEDDAVYKRVTKHLRRSALYQNTHVTLITHASFLRLPEGLRNPRRWEIFIDETPQIDQFLMARLPQTRKTLAGYLEFKQSTEALVRIEKKTGVSLDSLLNDTGLEGVKGMLHKIGSDNYTVYSTPEACERVFDPTKSDFDPSFSLPLLAMVKPEIFDGCCVLSANFEDSMLFDLLRRHRHHPKPHPILTKNLRYNQYPPSVGTRASIKYLLEGRRYSKSLRDNETSDGKNVKTAIDETILAHLGDEPFLLVANNDDKGLLIKSSKAERLSGSPHGLNCYQDHTRVVFVSARNRKPMHLSMLGKAGFSQETIQRSTLIESVHQSVMRTALRDPASTATVEIIVPDEWTAKELGKILGCANISKLGTIMLNAPAVPYTQIEKNNRYKFQKLMRSLPVSRNASGVVQDDGTQVDAAILLPSLLKSIKKSNHLAAFGTTPATNTLSSGIWFTLHDTVYASGSGEHTQVVGSIIDFVKFLKVAARTSIARKDEHPLFIPSIFKRSGSTGYRTKEKFVSASCLVLDFDGGTLSPEVFEDIFWNKAGLGKKRSFIICNTFSRSPSSPNKFRVIMPFKRPVTSITVFQAILGAIAQRLEDAGYDKGASILDKVCSNPAHPYYLPCTNRDYENYAFFRTHGTQTRSFERHGIDPAAYEATLLRAKPQPTAWVHNLQRTKNGSPEARQHIDAEKQRLESMPCDRHHSFFKLGVLMARKYGYPLYEVERELLDVAGSDSHMKKKVRDAMASLRKPHRASMHKYSTNRSKPGH